MPVLLENSTVATGLEKVSFHSNPKERQCQRMFKLPHNCTHLKLKILQARLQQYLNRELPDVQAGFRKGRGTRDQIVDIRWIIKIYRICCFNYLCILSSHYTEYSLREKSMSNSFYSLILYREKHQ